MGDLLQKLFSRSGSRCGDRSMLTIASEWIVYDDADVLFTIILYAHRCLYMITIYTDETGQTANGIMPRLFLWQSIFSSLSYFEWFLFFFVNDYVHHFFLLFLKIVYFAFRWLYWKLFFIIQMFIYIFPIWFLYFQVNFRCQQANIPTISPLTCRTVCQRRSKAIMDISDTPVQWQWIGHVGQINRLMKYLPLLSRLI